jgi:nucleotide-binding universal stress UspA family protein
MAILVAISDDDRFEAVLEVAEQLARGMDQTLTVAHVTDNETASGDERGFRDEVRSFLSETNLQADISLEHLNRSGLRSGTAIGKQLVDIAEGVEIDHVVIGHRSKSQLAELRDGHTGFVVAQEATVPVTIVPDAVGG